ncbi:MAG: site-specific DNA-methyltransferase [Acidimicrobiales bacterium]
MSTRSSTILVVSPRGAGSLVASLAPVGPVPGDRVVSEEPGAPVATDVAVGLAGAVAREPEAVSARREPDEHPIAMTATPTRATQAVARTDISSQAMAERRRRPTATSSFGVSKREGHDASAFYARFAPPELSHDDHVNEPKAVDELIVGDARSMHDVADASVALVVTSPPYFAGKDYEAALGEGPIPADYVAYLAMLEDVFAECVRTLEPGGRIAVNVANLGRKPFRSLAADVITILQDRLRLLLRGEVVWQKAKGAGGSCAWGSYLSPANPSLRDTTERVIIASKGRFDRVREGLATIAADEFMEATLDVWALPPESATRVGHPAPFPPELPQRLIELYTWRGDLVLDPFMGSGSTAVAAVRTDRRYIGYDTDADYVAAARERVAELAVEAKIPGRARAAVVAQAAVERAGFAVTTIRKKPFRGAPITVDLVATDAQGRAWWFLIAGGFTTGPGGLRRSEVLWRAIGEAAVLHACDAAVPIVVLTTGAASRGTAHEAALRPLLGTVLHAVVDLTADPEIQLRALI